MGPFNNREIATAFWLLVLAAWGLQRAGARKSLAGLVGTFCDFKILASVCLMLLYTAAVVALLGLFGLWKIALLKDTIVWFCVIAMAMMVRFITSHETEDLFQKALVDNIKIVILLEFLVNTYSFSLPAELIFVPLLTVIAMVDTIASLDKKHSAVAKLTKGVLTIIGCVILAIVLSRAISDLQNLQSLDTVRSIALAPLLSVLLLPFLYVLLLISKYESVFHRLNLGIDKERGLKRYARRRILMHAGFRLRRLQHLLRHHAGDLMHIQSEADVHRFLDQARRRDSSASEE